MKSTINYTKSELQMIIENHEWTKTFENVSKDDEDFYKWCKLQLFKKNNFPRKKINKRGK